MVISLGPHRMCVLCSGLQIHQHNSDITIKFTLHRIAQLSLYGTSLAFIAGRQMLQGFDTCSDKSLKSPNPSGRTCRSNCQCKEQGRPPYSKECNLACVECPNSPKCGCGFWCQAQMLKDNESKNKNNVHSSPTQLIRSFRSIYN